MRRAYLYVNGKLRRKYWVPKGRVRKIKINGRSYELHPGQELHIKEFVANLRPAISLLLVEVGLFTAWCYCLYWQLPHALHSVLQGFNSIR